MDQIIKIELMCKITKIVQIDKIGDTKNLDQISITRQIACDCDTYRSDWV